MLLKGLTLRNIRSYNDGARVHLDLPDGVVLFEGDIGSGKSTLLYAVEFGLFGLSDMKGVHLLSEGREEGGVTITFEQGGTEYTVERKLKVKGEDVVQDECYISSRGEKTRLSPSDLKEKVVAVLGFNEPTHPKAESLVYRYAVFTPQEQMKGILVQNADQRLHVIRRVLGAQSYQVAAENSELVEKRIRVSSYGLRKASEDVNEKEDRLKSVASTASTIKEELPRLKEREAAAAAAVLKLEAEWKESLGEREGLRKIEGRIPLLRQEVADLQDEVLDEEESLLRMEKQLREEINPLIARFEARARPPSSSRALQEVLDSQKGELARMSESRRSHDADLAKDRDLLSKGYCPLCGQKISGDLPGRAEHSERETARLDEAIEKTSQAVAALSAEVVAARSYEDEEAEYRQASKDRVRVDEEIRSLRVRLQQSNSKLSSKRAELVGATSQANEVQRMTAKITALESELRQAREGDKRAALDLKQAATELADAYRELESLTTEVRKKHEDLRRAKRLEGYQGWLSNFFRPSVEEIERQTLSQAAARFNEHFQRFFTALVDDPDMVVRVREDFSPIFEREGFEQDFDALSGGERTSMALAYRFALNSVVKEASSAKPELVILDEPTDGFSKEQIYRMRGLLEELDSRQVILVSHERELESMADHIFRVEKKDGTSMVAQVGP
jgi:DNA repair protein SbcC/Rad50